MLLIQCPFCGQMRPELEFTYAGQAHVTRMGPDASDEEFRDFLFIRDNPKGEHAERWRHTHGCGRFFNVVRNTVTDRIVHTYKIGEPRPGQATGSAPSEAPAAVASDAAAEVKS